MTLPDRLMSKVSPEPNSGCWLWMGEGHTNGYGLTKHNGKTHLVRRLMYEITRGPIPDGLELDHLCRVRCCVNPTHLEAVTHQENMQRSPLSRKGSEHLRKKTHCPKGHPYDAANTYKWRGRRLCRECNRQRSRERARQLANNNSRHVL
jgi:HNH endonuclease